MVLALGGLPGPFVIAFLGLYFGAQPSGTTNPKASQMSSCLPTNGVICLALPLCSTILIERISSRISNEEQKDFLNVVVFQTCFRYEN